MLFQICIAFFLTMISIGSANALEFDSSRIKVLLSPVETLASLNRRRETQSQEVADAMFQACRALEELAAEPEFGELLDFYREHQYDSDWEPRISELFDDFVLFLEFLKVERTIC